nr:uncharacterized protein LOC123765701 [Procambarus clarkii]
MVLNLRVSVCVVASVVLAVGASSKDDDPKPCVRPDLNKYCGCASGTPYTKVQCSCRDGEPLYLSENEADNLPYVPIQLEIRGCSSVTLGPKLLTPTIIRVLALTNITNLTIDTDSLELFESISVIIDSIGNLTLMPRAVTIEPFDGITRSFNLNVTNSSFSHLPEDAIVYNNTDNLEIYAANNLSPCKCENVAWLTTKNYDKKQEEVAHSITCPEGLHLDQLSSTCGGANSVLWAMTTLAGSLMLLSYVYLGSSCLL